MSILDQYYEDVSLFEEHTWGADVKTWLGPDRVYEKELFLEAKPSESYQFMEASWEEQRERARRAAKRRQELKELLERDAEEGIYLFNPNNTSYTGWVVLESGHLDVEHQGLSSQCNPAGCKDKRGVGMLRRRPSPAEHCAANL